MVFAGNEDLVKNYKLSGLQKEGVKLVVRYGLHIKALSSAKEATEKFTAVMKKCGSFLQKQQRKTAKSSLRIIGPTDHAKKKKKKKLGAQFQNTIKMTSHKGRPVAWST